jgi:hypothetical protein
MQTALVANDDDAEAQAARTQRDINAFVTCVRGAMNVIGKLEYAREYFGEFHEWLDRTGQRAAFDEYRATRRAPSGDAQPVEVVELGTTPGGGDVSSS